MGAGDRTWLNNPNRRIAREDIRSVTRLYTNFAVRSFQRVWRKCNGSWNAKKVNEKQFPKLTPPNHQAVKWRHTTKHTPPNKRARAHRSIALTRTHARARRAACSVARVAVLLRAVENVCETLKELLRVALAHNRTTDGCVLCPVVGDALHPNLS